MATSKKTTTYTAPTYTYTANQNMAQNTVPKAKKVTKIKGGTNAANQGLTYLNQLDTNLGGLYGNASQILIDNGALQSIESARKNMQDMTNRQYNDNANTYYQMYKQNQAKLPENLSRLGITGGASETASLNQLNNYSTNLYNNESARANALNEGNMKYDQMIADNSVQLSRQLADMYYNLGKGLLDERRANARADYEWGRGVDYDRYKYNRDVGYDDYQYNRNISREDELNAYDRALAQAQYTGDFSVMKRYGWSDSDVSKANALVANSGTSGGSGGYGSYYGSGGYGGSDSDSDEDNVPVPETNTNPNLPNLYWNPNYGSRPNSDSTKVNTSAIPYKSDKTGVTLNARDVSLYDDRNKYTKRYAYTR